MPAYLIDWIVIFVIVAKLFFDESAIVICESHEIIFGCNHELFYTLAHVEEILSGKFCLKNTKLMKKLKDLKMVRLEKICDQTNKCNLKFTNCVRIEPTLNLWKK